MTPTFRLQRAALALLLPLAAACFDVEAPDPRPTVVAQPAPPPTTPTAAAPRLPETAFPALTKPGTIYVETTRIYAAISYPEGPPVSRVAVYDDGRLGIQFLSPRWGYFEYGGNYARADSTLGLTFDGWSVMGPWEATATLRGDSLTIRYNLVMQLSDFVDGTYVREVKAP